MSSKKNLIAAAMKPTPLKTSMESDASGKRNRELEYTFYGKVADLKDLYNDGIKHEQYEQWNLTLPEDAVGKLRIRSINDGEQYILTSKIKRDGQKGCEEVESRISRDMFEHLRESATGGYKKNRYFFPVEGTELVWEIDVFKNTLGEDHDWVKLDLEVPEEGTEIPKLPITFAEFITHQTPDQTTEECAQIEKLWGSDWVKLDPSVRQPETTIDNEANTMDTNPAPQAEDPTLDENAPKGPPVVDVAAL